MPKRLQAAVAGSDDDTRASKRAQTGRPRRSNAGMRSLPDGYLDPEQVADQIKGDVSDPPSDSEVERMVKKAKKAFPKPRDLSEEPPEVSFDGESIITDPTERQVAPQAIPKTLSLTFNVPAGHTGPFVVNVDLGSLLANFNAASRPSTTPEVAERPLSATTKNKIGFLDLPAELRNNVYNLVLLKKDERICFPPKKDRPSRSPALLATCRQIQHEAAAILYGEHTFQFSRCDRKRGKFFQAEEHWKTVGFKDVRLFLQTIGPANIAAMRKIVFIFEDGTSDKSDVNDTHRFINDVHLIACLKYLASHSSLRYLGLSFHPRRKVYANSFTDLNFLSNLYQIKADKVRVVKHPRWPAMHYSRPYWCAEKRVANMDLDLIRKIPDKMERKTKLYPAQAADDDETT